MTGFLGHIAHIDGAGVGRCNDQNVCCEAVMATRASDIGITPAQPNYSIH